MSKPVNPECKFGELVPTTHRGATSLGSPSGGTPNLSRRVALQGESEVGCGTCGRYNKRSPDLFGSGFQVESTTSYLGVLLLCLHAGAGGAQPWCLFRDCEVFPSPTLIVKRVLRGRQLQLRSSNADSAICSEWRLYLGVTSSSCAIRSTAPEEAAPRRMGLRGGLRPHLF